MRWLSPLTLASLFRAGSPEVEPVVDIAFDVAELPESRRDLTETVKVEVNRALARQPLPPGVFVADDRQVLVHLRPGPIPGQDDIIVQVAVTFEGEVIGESITDACFTCTNLQVADKTLELLEPLLVEFPAPEPEPVQPEPVPPEPDVAVVEAPARPSPLLITGATLLGTGVAALGVGIGLVAVDERIVSPPGAIDLDIVEYRDPGIAVAVIGGAAAVTGSLLLGLALGARGRARVAAAPAIGPQHFGVSLVGRF